MSETLNKIGAETEAAKRAALQGLLNKCLTTQQLFFLRIYGEEIEAEKLDEAIKLCERTILKNEKS